jgi:hypothetical protein
MSYLLKLKSLILLGTFAFFVGSCGIVTNPNFIQYIGILGAKLTEHALAEIIERGVDALFEAIFQKAVEATPGVVPIEPLSDSEKLLGRKIGDHIYLVEGRRAGRSIHDEITIPTSEILFMRQDINSAWQLTPESRIKVLERLEIASAQLSLKDLGYNLGRREVDGILGPKTKAAIKKFQKNKGLSPTGALDDYTKQLLLTN